MRRALVCLVACGVSSCAPARGPVEARAEEHTEVSDRETPCQGGSEVLSDAMQAHHAAQASPPDERHAAFERAARLYEAILAEDCGQPGAEPTQRARFFLAEIYFHRLDRYEAAAELYLSFAHARPDDEPAIDALYNAIDAFERCERWDDVLEVARLYLERHPDHADAPEVRFRMGRAHLAKDEHQLARRAWLTLIDESPESELAAPAAESLLDSLEQSPDAEDAAAVRARREHPAFESLGERIDRLPSP